MKYRSLILATCIAVLVLAACGTDGTSTVKAVIENPEGQLTIGIIDRHRDNSITIYPHLDQIYCGGNTYNLRIDFLETGDSYSSMMIYMNAETLCQLGQEGIDLLVGYRGD